METLSVIKIGGNIIDNEASLSSFLKSFASTPGKKILVHGGGKLATKLASQLEIPQQLVDGRRITDADTLKVVTMVYAGYINKNIVARLQSHGCNSIGLCGADGNAIQAHKRNHPNVDYGFVGDIDIINVPLFKNLLSQDISIVMAPITHDKNGQLLNTNADTIAQEIAKGLAAHYDVSLIYSFEKAGVLLDANDNETVIRFLTPGYYSELKDKNLVFAGMLPKLDNAFVALDSGVTKVIIGQADQLEQLIAGNQGTTIINE
ncbi:acetylglutamate kinase [Flavisolibacter ginsengisoli]|uniref:Acetylglutamate kinase n=1 Tax=Flavisolibacter ginsengisoli DSM 18119 TaxID=1121884 RepID=A0A1M5DSC0_9BACT|nr:acetylglutamate kinase [Flavisolibacter ginsengisoli]SHF69850.1 N-acetylglutamate kinase [Flavisolibacter ginsengisoli DSM 18119]